MPLSGNKGEWSEVYALLRMLADGRVYEADGNGEKTDKFYSILCILVREGGRTIEYGLDEEENRTVDGEALIDATSKKISEEAEYLFHRICEGANKKGAFGVERTEAFLKKLHRSGLKAPSGDKSDVRLKVHDPYTGKDLTLGFGIKSMVGNPPTHVNASGSTNFLFRTDGDVKQEWIDGSKKEEGGKEKSKVGQLCRDMHGAGVAFRLLGADNHNMQENLILLDDGLPEIVGEMLKLHYCEGISDIEKQISVLAERNPRRYPGCRPYYELKIKKMLSAYALGMNSAKPWDGKEDANGGYIIVNRDNSVVCYSTHNRNDFEDYLVKHTKLETPSTGRHGFGEITKRCDGTNTIKLNLQIRLRNGSDANIVPEPRRRQTTL
ncbi:MAG: HpaII family restriction endonuclease [Candidatus Methanoplasma sp.]|jgi:type II restriction enzyme|nr:HpaII family restriction endonuclease [Candidatus Methanoplasma sp.]